MIVLKEEQFQSLQDKAEDWEAAGRVRNTPSAGSGYTTLGSVCRMRVPHNSKSKGQEERW